MKIIKIIGYLLMLFFTFLCPFLIPILGVYGAFQDIFIYKIIAILFSFYWFLSVIPRGELIRSIVEYIFILIGTYFSVEEINIFLLAFIEYPLFDILIGFIPTRKSDNA